jgi:hypothetical protein
LARRDALPSDEEIAAAERLVASNDKKLAELDEHFPVEFGNLVTQKLPRVFPTSSVSTRTR